MVEGKRLRHEIRGSGLHRLYRRFHRSESGDHDDGSTRILAPERSDKLQAIHARQLQVGNDQIGPVRRANSLLGRPRLIDIEAGGLQLQLHDAPELLLVLDYQNPLFHRLKRGLKRRKGRNPPLSPR